MNHMPEKVRNFSISTSAKREKSEMIKLFGDEYIDGLLSGNSL